MTNVTILHQFCIRNTNYRFVISFEESCPVEENAYGSRIYETTVARDLDMYSSAADRLRNILVIPTTLSFSNRLANCLRYESVC
ncbi:hypothetical protein D3C78_920600 [compost metagenome]